MIDIQQNYQITLKFDRFIPLVKHGQRTHEEKCLGKYL